LPLSLCPNFLSGDKKIKIILSWDTICPRHHGTLPIKLHQELVKTKKEKIMVKNVTVYLDNERPELNRVRCGFIVAENEAGEETFHNDLIDNSEYCSIKELIDDISGLLQVHREVVWVTA
jgi:hypothetical protein